MSDVALVLIVILVVVVLWRGPKTLPQLGKALGRGIQEARREATGEAEDTGEAKDKDSPSDRPNA